MKHSVVAHLYITYSKIVLCITRLMSEQSEIEFYNPSYSVYSRAGNIDILSLEGFLKLQKGKVYYKTQLTAKCLHQVGRLSVRIC